MPLVGGKGKAARPRRAHARKTARSRLTPRTPPPSCRRLPRARMAELVDAPASGAGDRKVVEVRVLFRAPFPVKDGHRQFETRNAIGEPFCSAAFAPRTRKPSVETVPSEARIRVQAVQGRVRVLQLSRKRSTEAFDRFQRRGPGPRGAHAQRAFDPTALSRQRATPADALDASAFAPRCRARYRQLLSAYAWSIAGPPPGSPDLRA